MTGQNIVNTRGLDQARAHQGSIADIAGLHLGHFTSSQRLTGCTVILAPDGAVGAVEVRGAAPGTRETELLDPVNWVDRVHAVLLTGGSAFGLDAAGGVMRWLEEHDLGLTTPYGKVPIVPAAVLFDLGLVRPGDRQQERPDAAAGYAACQAAYAAASAKDTAPAAPASGNVGAGAGAVVGKLYGWHRAMKGGIGHALVRVGPWQVAATVACNAVGDVIDPDSGEILAGARSADGKQLLGTEHALLQGIATTPPTAGTHTTIGVIATNARLSKAQAKRLAIGGHGGLSRCIRPAHTLLDGDTLFVLATGAHPEPADLILLSVMATQATVQATLNAIMHAAAVSTISGDLPAATTLPRVQKSGVAEKYSHQAQANGLSKP